MATHDSWIDQDELKELVGAFSSSRRKRRASLVRKSGNSSPKEAPEIDGIEANGERGEPAEGEENALAISSIDSIDEYQPAEATILREDEIPKAGADHSAPPADPLEEPGMEWDVEIVEEAPEVDEAPEKKGVRFFEDEEPVSSEEDESTSGGSEADAAKAVKALAEARSKIDRGGLIRSREKKGLVEELDRVSEDPQSIPRSASGEEDLREKKVKGSGFFDELSDEEFFSDIPPELPGKESLVFSEKSTVRERLADFATLLHDRLNAADVLVVDGNGFPLFEETGGTTAEAIEKSGGPNRLINDLRSLTEAVGFPDRVSSQILLGDGRWLCLFYSVNATDDGPSVRAVFPRPLECDQLQKWSNLLGTALVGNNGNGRATPSNH